jgi:signal transduction histidine kinase
MKVAHRLYLTVVPAVLGVLTVAGLAYWGRYANVVPHLVLIVAAVASVGSLVLSWVNARYVAHRIERLASGPITESSGALFHAEAQRDELDAIEGVVDHLSSAVVGAEAASTERERIAEERTRAYAQMVASIAAASAVRLEEVRLPLHILLENRFGDLNENQEEMLGAARVAAEAVDADVVALGQLAELDLGNRLLRRDRLLLGDVVRALVPTLQAAAEQAGVTLRVDIEPLVPAIHGDQPQLHDALTTVLGDAIRASASGAELELTLARDGSSVRITLRGAGTAADTVRGVLANRIISASGGTVAYENQTVEIRFGL